MPRETSGLGTSTIPHARTSLGQRGSSVASALAWQSSLDGVDRTGTTWSRSSSSPYADRHRRPLAVACWERGRINKNLGARRSGSSDRLHTRQDRGSFINIKNKSASWHESARRAVRVASSRRRQSSKTAFAASACDRDCGVVATRWMLRGNLRGNRSVRTTQRRRP